MGDISTDKITNKCTPNKLICQAAARCYYRCRLAGHAERWNSNGTRQFELDNHLGNVMAAITDKRIQHSSDNTTTDYFMPDVVAEQEYYAFGALMPGRSVNTAGYRYGFNGKENDVGKGTGNQQDYGMRIYDPRVGRFLSVDPIALQYPELTPFQFGSNNPIENIDLDGLEGVPARRQQNGSFSTAQSSTYHPQPKFVAPKLAPTNAEMLNAERQKLAADPVVGLITDKYGYSWPVTQSEAAALKQQHDNYVTDATSGSPSAAIGYLFGGEKGMNIGLIVGGVTMARYGNGAPNVFAENKGPIEPGIELPPLTSVRSSTFESKWDVLSTNMKYDAGAYALAKEINGVPQARFRGENREFDAISDKYIGQHKPALKDNFGASFRSQALATFGAASNTGRGVYYRFDSKPGDKVIQKLEQYSREFHVNLVIKY